MRLPPRWHTYNVRWNERSVLIPSRINIDRFNSHRPNWKRLGDTRDVGSFDILYPLPFDFFSFLSFDLASDKKEKNEEANQLGLHCCNFQLIRSTAAEHQH